MSTLQITDKALIRANGIAAESRKDPEPETSSSYGRAPEIGDRKTFVPAPFDASFQGFRLTTIRSETELTVTGAVVYVNEAHRWYRVRYETPLGGAQFESFKF